MVCRHTGKKLTMKNTHIDHVGEYEFADIVKLYIKHNDISRIKYKNTDHGDEFANKLDGLRFKRFHDVLCLLEPVHKTHNLSRGKGKAK
jgi:hypothetical protein